MKCDGAQYAKGCRCPDCREANARKSREWRRRNAASVDARGIGSSDTLGMLDDAERSSTYGEWARNNGYDAETRQYA